MTNEMWKEMSQPQGDKPHDYQGPLYAPHPNIYHPKVNDYVKYNTPVGNHLEGWIYWIDEQKRYLTLEIMVREKSEQSYKDCNIHRNERCLVCCYPENWIRGLVCVYPENWYLLEYVKSR